MVSDALWDLSMEEELPEELALKLRGISHCLVNSVPPTISLAKFIRWMEDRANRSSIIALLDDCVREFSDNQKSVVEVDHTWVSDSFNLCIYCALVDAADSPRFIGESDEPQGVLFAIGAYDPGMRYVKWATAEEHAVLVASRRTAGRRREQKRRAQLLIKQVLRMLHENQFKSELAAANPDQQADAEFHMSSRPRMGDDFSTADVELMLAAFFALDSPVLNGFIEAIRDHEEGL